jgi:phosphate transport system permease protein
MRRRLVDRAATAAAMLCGLLVLATALSVVATLAVRAAPALGLELLTAATREAGAAGGLRDQLLGTGILTGTALLVAAPLALALALAQAVYLGPRAARALGLLLAGWNALPSIVLGLLGFLVLCQGAGWGKSWLAGGIVLGLLIVPLATEALAARLGAVPRELVWAARGLGLSRQRTVWAVELRWAWPGLLSGLLLGLARAAGETAPLLFTAAVFSGAGLPQAIRESPVLALPYHVFVLAQDTVSPAAEHRLWAAALVLLGFVLTLSLLALPLRLGRAQRGVDG